MLFNKKKLPIRTQAIYFLLIMAYAINIRKLKIKIKAQTKISNIEFCIIYNRHISRHLLLNGLKWCLFHHSRDVLKA